MYTQLIKSNPKFNQTLIEERLQNMVDKLQSFRQSDFFMKKSNIMLTEPHKNSGKYTKSSTRFTGLRKSEIIERPSNGFEIEELLTKFQKNTQREIQQKSLVILKEPKMIKSQFICIPEESEIDFQNERWMKAQKSQSEMKYLEICNTSREYVQEFLNVLEDFSQHNPEKSYLDGNIKTAKLKKTASSSSSSQKHLQRIQEQQEQISPVKEKSWKQRCQEAITKSRRIMDKVRSSTKFSQVRRNS